MQHASNGNDSDEDGTSNHHNHNSNNSDGYDGQVNALIEGIESTSDASCARAFK